MANIKSAKKKNKSNQKKNVTLTELGLANTRALYQK